MTPMSCSHREPPPSARQPPTARSPQSPHRPLPAALPLALLAALLALLPGCVTRKLFIQSEPPGAEVWLDGQRAGTTPYAEELAAYGRRSLELRLAGHERVVTLLDLPMPWYQYWPLDMFSEFLWPWELRDVHTFRFALGPIDPEAEDWDAARAAYERLQEFRAGFPAQQAPPEEASGG